MAAAASAPVLVSSSGAGTGYHRGCMNKGRGGQTEQHFFEYKKVVVSSAGGFSFCFLSPASFFLPFFTHVFLGGLRWQEGRSNKFRALIFVMTKRVTPWTRVRPPLVLDGLLVRIPIDINVNNLRARRIHTKQTLAYVSLDLDTVSSSIYNGLPTELAIIPMIVGVHQLSLRLGSIIQTGTELKRSLTSGKPGDH